MVEECAESVLSNHRAEMTLLRFIHDSLEKRILLANVVLPAPAGEEFKRLCHAANLYKPKTWLEVGTDGSLRLTPEGVEYLIKTADPDYQYHISAADSREAVQQEVARAHRRPRLY